MGWIREDRTASILYYIGRLPQTFWSLGSYHKFLGIITYFLFYFKQGKVVTESNLKLPHEITCLNSANQQKLEPPYFWNAKNVTCRDWKLRYCCENMWGQAALYNMVREQAKKRVPKSVSATDVLVDKPTKSRSLFQDCRWGNYMRYHISCFHLKISPLKIRIFFLDFFPIFTR